MSVNKKIDPFFQEKLNGFEATPNPKIWANIKAELEKKEDKKRIFPFWWKFSGIAAVLLIGFFIGQNYTSVFKPENAVVVEKSASTSNNDKAKNKDLKQSSKGTNVESTKLIEDLILENQSANSYLENVVVENAKSSSKNNSVGQKGIQKKEVVIFQNKSIITNSSSLEKKESTEIDVLIIKNKLAENSQNKFVNSDENSIQKVADNNEEPKSKSTTVTDKSETKQVEDTNKNALETLKPTVKEIIASVPNELETLAHQKEKPIKIKTIKNAKWEVATNLAQVYMNSVSEGSSVDPKYEANSKTFDANLSYGLGVKYAVSKKIKLRTGINKVSLSYSTNDVPFYTSAAIISPNLINVNLADGLGLSFLGNNDIPTTNATSTLGEISLIEKGSINQKIGYFEVPTEISYSLIDKKIGITIIGGLSTLFLNENDIAAVSKSQTIASGKATNLNQVHFSTNIGIGLKYSIIPSVQINVDPMLKYQINTFTNDVGGFKPYLLGLYSGISYRF